MSAKEETISREVTGFTRSDDIAKLAPALLKAQRALANPAKNKKNPHIGNNYADLGAVLDSAKEALNKNDLSVTQVFAPAPPGYVGLTTLLIHESGQYIGGTITLPAITYFKEKDPQQTAQGAGSAATYARRYGIQAIIGMVAEDDDDGNEVSGHTDPAPISAKKRWS